MWSSGNRHYFTLWVKLSFWLLQHCELNSESEIRWGPQGGACFDAIGERVVLSRCPVQRPAIRSFQWKFARVTIFIEYTPTCPCARGFCRISLWVCSAAAERSAGSPAVPVVSGSRHRSRALTQQPKGHRHPLWRASPAPLHPSPQTTVAL